MDENNNKKKIRLLAGAAAFAFVALIALVLISLAIIVDTNNRIVEKDGLLQDMHGSLIAVNRSLGNMSQAGLHDSDELTESSNTAKEAPSYTQEELINMAVSDDFANMMIVALYPEATESHLLFIATACTYSDSVEGETSAVRLATALLDHPNVTKAVVSTLAQSKSPVVWLLVAQSELCSESTLAVLADNCISFSFGTNKDDLVVAVASAICENDAATENIFNILEHTTNGYIRFIVDTKLGKFPQP